MMLYWLRGFQLLSAACECGVAIGKNLQEKSLANLPSKSTVRNDLSIKRLKACGKSVYDLPTHTLCSAVLYSSTLTSRSCFHTEGVIKKAYTGQHYIYEEVIWAISTTSNWCPI